MIPKRFEELRQSGALPTPSGVGLVVLRRTQDQDCALEDLVECIQVDPALTGRLVKLANSASWQGAEPVTTVQQAAIRLGARAVRGVALGFTLVSSNRSGACAHFDYDRYWSYSIACASAAQILAGEAGIVDPHEAFTCALLSRVGMLALASVHPDEFATILAAHRATDATALLAAESRAFDIQHFEVAGALVADWGLPSFYGAAIESLSAVDGEADDDALVAATSSILREASAVAEILLSSMRHQEWVLGLDWVDVLAHAGDASTDRERLRPIVEQAAGPWREWCTLFRLPASPAASTTEPPRPRLRLVTAPAAESPSSSAPIVRPEAFEPLAQSEIRVLAVDDDPRILRLLGYHLRQAGFTVSTAKDGAEGLRVALEEDPHIVVTDLVMPEIDGLALCRSLRRSESCRRSYVIVLTAREEEQQVVDAFGAGADDYVTKPFNPRILLARVQAGQRMVEMHRQVEADKRNRMRQAAEMGLLARRLRAAAHTDVLTELPNRRYAMTRLQQEWDTASRLNRPLSVVLADIDHFKRVNDAHGHDVGDEVLRGTASVLRGRTRRGDVVCRLGGEEFLVINVNCGLKGALLCAERLRRAVEAHAIQSGSFEGRVTVSLGCAQRTPAHRGIDDLLKSADEAAYAAKAAGRNTIHGASNGLSEAG